MIGWSTYQRHRIMDYLAQLLPPGCFTGSLSLFRWRRSAWFFVTPQSGVTREPHEFTSMPGVHKALQGTSGQRGFSEFTLLPKSQLNQSSVLQIPLAPELGRSVSKMKHPHIKNY